MIKKIKGKTLYLALSVVLSAVGFFVLLSQPAFATDFIQDPIGSAVATVVGLIAYVIVYVLGNILSLLISVLVNVAQFNNIINVPTVVEGWVIIRDLCNMVFILALLVIAFATILRVEGYSLKKLLPKLLIAAILINFSRTIFGLIIDFSQVIMLTFVQGFSGHGAGHLVDFFQVKDVLAIWDGNDDENLKAWSIAGGIIAGVIAVIISVIVVSVLLAVLVVRVVMLWVYTILSPLIFLGMAFPPLKSYTSSLWQDFIKQIMVGPIIAFFIWLAVVTIETSSQALDDMVPSGDSGQQVCAGVNQFFCENSFQTYILAIAFLMGGLVVAQKVGSVTAKAASKAEGWSKQGMRWASKPATLAGTRAVDEIYARKGYDLNLKRSWSKMQDERKVIKREKELSGELKAGQRLGSADSNKFQTWASMSGTPGHAWRMIMSKKGRSQLARGGIKMAEDKEDAKNRLDMLNSDKEQVKQKITKMEADTITLDNQIKSENDRGKRAELKAEKDKIAKRIKAAKEVQKIIESGDNSRIGSAKKKAQAQLDKSIPTYNWRAKVNEQKMVREKMDEIKDVTDSDELLRILREAMQENDKNKIKAITTKMAQNGDENEWLKPIEGDTTYKGLQKYADRLVRDHGFSKQEAYEWGSQISGIAKSNNVWSAAHAFQIKDGEWSPTGEDAHAEATAVETSKKFPQYLARNNNRKAYGGHRKDGSFFLNESGVRILQGLDNEAGIKEVRNNMNLNAAQMIASTGKLKDLKGTVLSDDLVEAIESRVKTGKEGKQNAKEVTHEEIKKALGKI